MAFQTHHVDSAAVHTIPVAVEVAAVFQEVVVFDLAKEFVAAAAGFELAIDVAGQ